MKPISTKRVSRIITCHWNLGRIKKVEPIHSGVDTHNWLVEASNNKSYIFRDAGEHLDHVKLQVDVLNYLQEMKFTYEFPRPLKTKKGNYLFNYMGRNYYLYEKLAGTELGEVSLESVRQIGEMMATYHQSVSEYIFWDGRKAKQLSRDLDKVWPVVNRSLKAALKLIVKQVIFQKSDQKSNQKAGIIRELELDLELEKEYLQNLPNFLLFLKRVNEEIKSVRFGDLPKIPCHGDLGPHNILRSQNDGRAEAIGRAEIASHTRIVGMIDFSLLYIDPKVVDVVVALDFCIFDDDGSLNRDLARAFFDGYLSIGKLSKEEMVLITPLLYRKMLGTLSWTVSEMLGGNKRVRAEVALRRIKSLRLLMDDYCSIGLIVGNFNKQITM